MISEARHLANIRNSAQSSGAATPDGQFRSSANAMTHGYSAKKHVPAHLEKQVRFRATSFEEETAPRGQLQCFLIREAAVASVLLEHCRDELQMQIAADALRAEGCWEIDRKCEMLRIASKLAKDPERVSQELRRTKQGTQWLLGRIHWLETCSQTWDTPQMDLAQNLLGIPLDQRCEPNIETLRSRLARLKGELEIMLESALEPLDELERAQAEAGRPAQPSAAVRRLRRHESALRRRFERSMQAFRALRREEALPRLQSPAPTPRPEPQPQAPIQAEPQPQPQAKPQAEPQPTPAPSVSEELPRWAVEAMSRVKNRAAHRAILQRVEAVRRREAAEASSKQIA